MSPGEIPFHIEQVSPPDARRVSRIEEWGRIRSTSRISITANGVRLVQAAHRSVEQVSNSRHPLKAGVSRVWVCRSLVRGEVDRFYRSVSVREVDDYKGRIPKSANFQGPPGS